MIDEVDKDLSLNTKTLHHTFCVVSNFCGSKFSTVGISISITPIFSLYFLPLTIVGGVWLTYFLKSYGRKLRAFFAQSKTLRRGFLFECRIILN